MKLKPCPFCGGEVEITVHESIETIDTMYRIECDNSGCRVQPQTYWEENTEQAITAWNERRGSK